MGNNNKINFLIIFNNNTTIQSDNFFIKKKLLYLINGYFCCLGLVVQLDRISDFGSDGWGFESLLGRYYFLVIIFLILPFEYLYKSIELFLNFVFLPNKSNISNFELFSIL